MSDLKIKIQRLDSQLRQTHGSYETKEKDFTELLRQRDEAVKERDTLITQIQEMEEKDQSKVKMGYSFLTWLFRFSLSVLFLA